LFWEQDKNRSGKISWPEFKSMCRKVLKLTDEDAQLLKIFRIIDNGRAGYITIGKMIAFATGEAEKLDEEEADAGPGSGEEDFWDGRRISPSSQRSSPLDQVETPPCQDGIWGEFPMDGIWVSNSPSSPSGWSPKFSHGEHGSPAILVRLLLKQYGCILRAWREELDGHGSGRVTCKDFARTCRRLGFSPQRRQCFWRTLSPHGEALEFTDLAPQREAQNLEDYVESLRYHFCFDLEAAWDHMDGSCQNFLTLEDFTRGAAWMNFKGDVKLIARGLMPDTKRITRKEFFYLKVVVQNRRRFLPDPGTDRGEPLADFRLWARPRFWSPKEFIDKLGLSGWTDEQMSVKDLVAYLTALGFEGDARQVAVKAAAAQPSSRGMITAAALYRALTDTSSQSYQDTFNGSLARNVAGQSTASSPAEWQKEPKWSPSGPTKQPWNNSLDDISFKNREKCQASRDYFKPPDRSLRRAMSYHGRTTFTAQLRQPFSAKRSMAVSP
jgi:hypothetical protein